MTSDESDDEPLSIWAAAKKRNPGASADIMPVNEKLIRRKRRKPVSKTLAVTIKLTRKSKPTASSTLIERPADVWLYLKDLNPTGPYGCLLCPEWFINRAKLIIHYVLNHKKDYCGICRYFVPDREAWWAHEKFHIPWPCSQCVENFRTALELREHLSKAHKLVHCRLCHFRVPDDDHYNTHLFQKHNVHNVSSKNEKELWELEYEGSNKFLCLLCSKSNNLNNTFFSHYMGYHHFTLKCLTGMLSGKDPPFTVFGANVRSEFVNGQLKSHGKFGYVDLDLKPIETEKIETSKINDDLTKVLKLEIKQEILSESEDVNTETAEDANKRMISDENDVTNTYKGEEDFDVTLMELIVLHKCYFDYVNRSVNDINSNVMPKNSEINYENTKDDVTIDVICSLCKTKQSTIQTFTSHMFKMHGIKSVPIFSCRVCATTFESQNELETHIMEELGDFDDLWICQFCDQEFDNREATRHHLSEHWKMMEYDNCFSPHLGFKCKYCPTLFWNETDREVHQLRVHFLKHKEDFYKCENCSKSFSDKIWYIHHYIEKHENSDGKNPTHMFKCCLCCVVLSNVEEMRCHFEVEHPEAKKVFCSLGACQYRPLCHRKSFKIHLKSIHSSNARTDHAVTCTYCGREFKSARACRAHSSQAHGPAKLKCKICREVMHTMDERKLHYLVRHPGRHPFECTECGKSFQYKSSLYMHKQDHAPNKQNFTCSYCGKVFKKKDSFREHVQIHEGPRHACSYCPMRFVQRSNMLRHERRHTGERPYQCQHCPRTFSDKGACTSHSRTHLKDRSYPCIYCGQTFVQKSKLTYHIRKHTGENLEKCAVCSKLFTSACALREHMKTHQNKNCCVKCPLCERTYQDERYMLRHLRTSHTRTEDFKCPICLKYLTSPAALRGHVIMHSGNSPFQCKLCPKKYSIKRTVVRHLRRGHSVKIDEVNTKEYYKILNPWECQLGLDEEVMTNIFGPPKKTDNNVLIEDFVTLTNAIQFAKNLYNTEIDCKGDGNSAGNEEENGAKETESRLESGLERKRSIKEENKSDESGNELEPTDFVSIKIEPNDEDELNN